VADISEVAAMTPKDECNLSSILLLATRPTPDQCSRTPSVYLISSVLQNISNSEDGARGGDRREEMAADFMLLIDLSIFAMVIARAAALLREEKGGLSSQRCCSSVRRTEGENRGPHKQAANLGFQLIPLSESSSSSRKQ